MLISYRNFCTPNAATTRCDRRHSTISPWKYPQHLPLFWPPAVATRSAQKAAATANSIKLWNYLKTRSKHQTNCGGILLAGLFSREPNRSFNGCFRFALRYGSTSVSSFCSLCCRRRRRPHSEINSSSKNGALITFRKATRTQGHTHTHPHTRCLNARTDVALFFLAKQHFYLPNSDRMLALSKLWNLLQDMCLKSHAARCTDRMPSTSLIWARRDCHMNLQPDRTRFNVPHTCLSVGQVLISLCELLQRPSVLSQTNHGLWAHAPSSGIN